MKMTLVQTSNKMTYFPNIQCLKSKNFLSSLKLSRCINCKPCGFLGAPPFLQGSDGNDRNYVGNGGDKIYENKSDKKRIIDEKKRDYLRYYFLLIY